ncbi:MAG: NYN domain-containing protein [Synechococcales bacterium]|nr:NYN domain-containing protein [Synechococcales bacterium]
MVLYPDPEESGSNLEASHEREFHTTHSTDMARLQSDLDAIIPRRDRVAIFIDGSNLLHAASHLNIEINYSRLLPSLARDRQILRAYFYTGVDSSNEKQQGFLLWMQRNGYHVVAKDLQSLPDGSRRASLEVEIAVDMITLASYCENLVLVSGNGNLTYVLGQLAYRGANVEVISLRLMTSESLISAADSYIDLASLREEIRKL